MSETKPTREVTLDFIRNHALFSGLDEEGLIHILTVGTDVMFKKDDYVVKDGESGEDFFLVLQGSLEVIKKISTSDGETIERISLINRGETFGEMAMIERMPRSASVRAIENTLALQFSHDKFDMLADTDPRTYSRIILNLAKQVSEKLRMVDVNFAISLFSNKE